MSIDIIGWINGWHLERFIKKLFEGSKSLWEKLSPTIQEIIKQSSGVLEAIVKMEGQTPQFVFDKITDLFPFFTKAKLDDVLTKLPPVLTLAAEDAKLTDPVEIIAALDRHIQAAHPDEREGILHTISTWIATFATPQDTTFGVITTIMKFVFKTFVQGKYSFPTV